MKRGYLGFSQYFYLAGLSAGHRERLQEIGVAAADTSIPMQKMIYVAAFQGGIEKFVTYFENASGPLDRFILARTLSPKERDPELLKKILELEPTWEKVEARHALRPLYFIYDLMVAMENKAAGCITAPANLISPDLRKVWDLMNEGKDVSDAQERVNKQRHVLEKYPPFPPLLKALLHRLHGLPRWSVKPPLESISSELEERALQEFENSNA